MNPMKTETEIGFTTNITEHFSTQVSALGIGLIVNWISAAQV